ncbi:MAG: RDD family protein [Acetobacteraceae bacterium]|nr:RDD family protein [Acetobacteraceae bacterium]
MPDWQTAPHDPNAMIQDEMLTRGVLPRRIAAWFIDLVLIAILDAAFLTVLFIFGLITLGLGMPLLALVPIVPFFYHFLFLAGMGATPGQGLLGLRVVRDEDLGPADPLRALISTLIYYVTLATSGLLLLVALVTIRKRTLHDLVSGLVVVRERALTAPSGFWNMQGGPPHA